MIRVVITDDEPMARLKLRQLLQGEPDVEVVGEATCASEAIALVKETRPTLLLLDIRMPEMDGFEVIAALSSDGKASVPDVVFTTAYDQYAVQAFELNAVDYLLKPYTRERLKAALDRSRLRLHEQTRPLSTSAGSRAQYTDRLVFKSRDRIVFLPVSQIYWVGAEENYVRITTATDYHLLRDTMANFEARLDPAEFLRIHRSTIVNLAFVKDIRNGGPNGDSVVTLANGHKLAISRGYRTRISEMMVP